MILYPAEEMSPVDQMLQYTPMTQSLVDEGGKSGIYD